MSGLDMSCSGFWACRMGLFCGPSLCAHQARGLHPLMSVISFPLSRSTSKPFGDGDVSYGKFVLQSAVETDPAYASKRACWYVVFATCPCEDAKTKFFVWLQRSWLDGHILWMVPPLVFACLWIPLIGAPEWQSKVSNYGDEAAGTRDPWSLSCGVLCPCFAFARFKDERWLKLDVERNSCQASETTPFRVCVWFSQKGHVQDKRQVPWRYLKPSPT